MNLSRSIRWKLRGGDGPARLVVFSVFLCLANCLNATPFAVAHSERAQAQSPVGSAKTGSGVITGKVTIKGKGAAGITVVLRLTTSDGGELPPRKVTTDQDGKYQIENVAPGAYQVAPIAPTFVIADAAASISNSLGFPGQRGKSVIVAENETVEDVDFALTPGGVITGKVTDPEGRTVIEEPVNVSPVGPNAALPLNYSARNRISATDDRGVYRIYGLPAGKYLVAVRSRQGGLFGGGPRGSQYRQTFYPGVIDASKATIVEVSEGGEATNIDITLSSGPADDTFSISGRIVDGTTGQPLPNVTLGLYVSSVTGVPSSSMTSTSWTSNQAGEFRFQNLSPGKYSVYIEPQLNAEFNSEPVAVELINQDVSGLVIKTVPSASISGVIVFEPGDAKARELRLGQFHLQVIVQREVPGGSRPVSVKPDGTFRVGGLEAGKANFLIISDPRATMGFRIVRVEREGLFQPGGIELTSGEAVSGIRLIVRAGSGSVRGMIRAEGGDLPPPPRLQVWLTAPGGDPTNPFPTFSSQSQVDARGHFLFENLAAGDYEVNATVFTLRGTVSTKQRVTVVDGVATELTLTLTLKP